MKTMRPLMLIVLLAAIVTSCSTSQNVGGGMLQKRKYTKGFYWNRPGNGQSADQATAKEDKKREEVRAVAAEETVTASSEVKTTREQAPVTAANTTVLTNQNVVPATEPATVTAAADRREAPFRKPASKTDDRKQTVLKKNKTVHEAMGKKQTGRAGDDDAMFILAVIFAILIPPLGVLIYTSIDWKKVLICLLLTILFFIPGLIYALLVVFDVI